MVNSSSFGSPATWRLKTYDSSTEIHTWQCALTSTYAFSCPNLAIGTFPAYRLL